jgi:hypothetical protein
VTVHVDELHSEVVPTPGASGGQADGRGGRGATPPWALQEQWREARRRAEWLAERVCAEGFDD